MNIFEQECFDLVEDMLRNRPRNDKGETVKYTEIDRKKYIQLAQSKKEEVEKKKNEMGAPSYLLLTEIYDSVLKFLKTYMI